MYYELIQSVRRRVILELRESFARHPVYNKVVDHIQNKYTFKERPQYAIVVKGASANKLSLSPDNFLGTVVSRVMLCYSGAPVFPLEWVREDASAIQANQGRMPTPPGVYFMEILQAPTEPGSCGQYILDPLITVNDELVLKFQSGVETECQLQNIPLQGTLRLWENRHFKLIEGTHYTIDYTTGAIRLLDRSVPGSVLTADYRYPVASVGPIEFQWNRSDFTTLPGVVLAFGKRAKVGDKVAIVVYDDYIETASAYGGRFDISLDLDIIAADPIQMEEMADFTYMTLISEKRPALSTEGIEITDVSIGGESEDVADETGDLFYYTSSMTVQIQSDWEVHEPLPLTISQVTPTTSAMDRTGSNDTTLHLRYDRLVYSSLPIIVNRNNNYERIT